MRIAASLLLALVGCSAAVPESATGGARASHPPRPAGPAPACVGEPEIRPVGAPGLFPVLTLTNAQPELRQRRSLRVPTRLDLRRDGNRFEVAWDPRALEPVEVSVGCHMLLGHEARHGVARPGTRVAAPAIELGGGTDFSGEAGQSTLFVDAPTGPGPWVVRVELTIFETDVPPQHEWSPRSERYRVLLERVVEAPLDRRD